ncbi:MAG: hypothetical protein IPP73_04335 [Chitinophagaceae bacterium]|nr:hypothetical protein [Chitinophagaceae bacterium]
MVTKLFTRQLIVWSLPFLLFTGIGQVVTAQKIHQKIKLHAFGFSHALAMDVMMPAGNFSTTHWGGAGLHYEYTNRRHVKMQVPAPHKFGFMAQGGFMYYAGKKEKTNDYWYNYPPYYVLYAYPGVIINRGTKFQAGFGAGPAIGFYNSRTRFHWGWILSSRYAVSKKISVGPSVQWTKEKGSRPLCAVGIQTAWAIH